MTNIDSSSHNNHNQTIGNTSPLTELNTSPQKDPFESTEIRYNINSNSDIPSLSNSGIELSPSDSKHYQSDSSSELSEINSEAETEKMDLPEGSELKAMAEFIAEDAKITDDNKDDAKLTENNGKDGDDAEVKQEIEAVVDSKEETREEAVDDGEFKEKEKDNEMKEEEREQNGGGEDEEDEELEAEEEEDVDSEELQKLKEKQAEEEAEKKAVEAEKQLFRQKLIEELTAIEIDYAKLKDLLYQNQLSRLEYELKLCLNGSHPDFIRILNKINDNCDRKIKTLVMSQNYKLDCINNQTKATRYQVHQQFLKNCQDLKLEAIEKTTTKWYEINKERRMMDQITVNNKKRVRDSDNKSILFNEIGRLNKIQKFYGFPSGIANLASAEDFEIEEDLNNMKRSFQL